MADENKPTPQQSQEAVQLDSLTSLQQPTESDQAGSANTAEVRADAVVTQPNTNAPEGPSFYLPNTDLTNAPPVQTGDSTVSETESEDDARPSNVEDALAGEGLLTVTVAVSPEIQAVSSESGEGGRSPDVMSASTGTGAPGPANTPRAGTTQARADVPLDGTEPAEVNEPVQVIESVTPVAATQPIELTVVPQVTEAVVTEAVLPVDVSPIALTIVSQVTDAVAIEPIVPVVATSSLSENPVIAESVSSLSSASVALTETDAVLSTSGTLTLADADATDATVVAQTDTAGAYGKFSIGTNGAWTYTTNDAANQLNAGQVVTEVFTVATSDGGSATVTVNLTGTNDVATLTSDTKALTETDAVLSTSGTLTLADADATDATVVAQTDTAGAYGKFSI
ncbi:VCBS domain-containing protein, partial [Zwartia panacis]|uniref:VCBS domain-containing protein n=1 Tax=Zwartia panacis TaxID=2683345 RepID=UPI0025B3A816